MGVNELRKRSCLVDGFLTEIIIRVTVETFHSFTYNLISEILKGYKNCREKVHDGSS